MEAKWNHGPINVELGHTSNGSAKNMHNTGQSGHKTSPMPVSLLPKSLLSAEERQKLRKQLFEVSRAKMPPHLQGLLKKFGFNCQRDGRIEVDIDAFDEETLWELKRIIQSSLGGKAAKVSNFCLNKDQMPLLCSHELTFDHYLVQSSTGSKLVMLIIVSDFAYISCCHLVFFFFFIFS